MTKRKGLRPTSSADLLLSAPKAPRLMENTLILTYSFLSFNMYQNIFVVEYGRFNGCLLYKSYRFFEIFKTDFA
jgi:hypothetical protein